MSPRRSKKSQKEVEKAPKKPRNPREKIAKCLRLIDFDFDCAVAVWVDEPNAVLVPQVISEAGTFGSIVSRSDKLCLKTRWMGMVIVFERNHSAYSCWRDFPKTKICEDFPIRTQLLSLYIESVATIESALMSQNPDNSAPQSSSIVIRNLKPAIGNAELIVGLCRHFGDVIDYEAYEDVGESFKFLHLIVSFPLTVQAFAAEVALDGKWVEELQCPLFVDLLLDDKVKVVKEELAKGSMELWIR